MELDLEVFRRVTLKNLYKRLEDVRRALAVGVSLDDEFEIGINCRLTNEEVWLMDLIHELEKVNHS